MNPAIICGAVLGKERIEAALTELSSPQIKAILKEGAAKMKLPGGYVSRQKRRKIWSARVLASMDEGNKDLAAEFLQQWLLNHRRPMLIRFLDELGAKHTQGETDDSFLLTATKENALEAGAALFGDYDRVEVIAYLRYIAFQQRSKVFDDWEELDRYE